MFKIIIKYWFILSYDISNKESDPRYFEFYNEYRVIFGWKGGIFSGD